MIQSHHLWQGRGPSQLGVASTERYGLSNAFAGENVQQRDELEPVASAIVCAESEEAKLAGGHDRG